MSCRKLRRNEAGSTMAEFAVVATLFFMVLIGIIEFSRLFYTHNALTDAARRGARYAVLHPQGDMACAKKVVVYGSHVHPNTCAPTGQPLINGLDPERDVTIVYNGTSGTTATPFGMNLGSVTVTIQHSFQLTLPLFSRTIEMPKYTTTLTAESAGTKPDDIP